MESDNSNSVAAKNKTRQKEVIAEGTSGNSGTSESDTSNSSTTPTTTDTGSGTTGMEQPPEMNCVDGETCTPPEMNCDPSSETCEMPEPPDGGMNGEFGGFGPGQGGMTEMAVAQTTSDSILHPAAYLAIGGGGVILGLLISYACFSKFFHLKPGQTFSSLAKFIWFIVVALLIAVGIGILGYFIPVWTR